MSEPTMNSHDLAMLRETANDLIGAGPIGGCSYFSAGADETAARGRALRRCVEFIDHAISAPLAAAPAVDGLHPATRDLVDRFCAALAEKLLAAQHKYGYSDGWLRADWMDECRAHLRQHVEKGDPRDVANYCAFLWHHGESTAGVAQENGNG